MVRKKKKRIGLRIFGITMLLLLIGGGAYAYSFYQSVTQTTEKIHQPIEREKSEKRVEEVEVVEKEPFSMLMLGVDEREGDRGRSDTMIVATVNPNNNSVKMVSIPRDTRTEIIGKGYKDKINHAYAFGGVEMSMDTVEDFLDIPIDYYLQINMEGYKDVVDAVGGVTVANDLEFSYGGSHFPEGEITLDGEKALNYSRMRYEDPRGDFGRQLRQRQVIKAVMKEGASISSLTNYADIFTALDKNIKTNLTFDEILEIQKHYKDVVNDIEQLKVEGSGTQINSIYYLQVPTEEQNRIQSELQTHLEI
ncbi:cell envelope-related function transcriptional attenuator common domain-containing protein [Mesobacillus persicus]|uniref:Polyisoprenyl-teichoic acid--peptidoglycan teichoic acid transferase TagU n=1 Tax=Mesobacillus persicus TaxID=930146 RepID=A0A1H8FYD3_9BACI|nr:LytR family transcriptional regulator [Mesobacillus persicus]SEN36659.1 cell envelope-related function transcriptional attenuator common domain-containing protein [Mesobacillus persicus]